MNDRHYTEREVDFAYLMGVFNVSGIDGLHNEIQRLKSLDKEPHDLFAAAGEGKPKPQEQYTPWRKCDYCCGSGAIILEGESTTCTKCFGAKGWYVVREPISVPSVEEISNWLFDEFRGHEPKELPLMLKQWLTERAK